MSIIRTDVLSALNYFLSGKISQEKIYEWALSQVVAKDYEQIADNDLLIKESIRALIDINHPGKDKSPTRDDLVYYLRCLEGKAVFEPLSVRLEKLHQRELEEHKEKIRKRIPKISIDREYYLAVARIYVGIFAAVSLLINIVSVINPDLLNPESQSVGRNMLEALPHILYSVVLLVPRRIMVKGWSFYFYFTVHIFGMLAYWVTTVSIIIHMDLHPILILVFAPFGGIPPTLALWLLWLKRKEFLRPKLRPIVL